MAIFDTHAHYHTGEFDEDRDTLLASLPQNNVVGVVNAATNLESGRRILDMIQPYPYMYAAVGIHPESVDTIPEDAVAQLWTQCSEERVVAIGEIGLDYYYQDGAPREIQQRWFSRQMELAVSLQLPVIIHDREAHEDVLNVVRHYRPSGIFHCFSGSVEMMKEIVGLNMYIGMGGSVTFKNARKAVEVAAAVPLDHLVLETDAPYMAPVPYRGQRCDSTMIYHTAACIAKIRGMDTEELLRITTDNARQLFRV